MVFSFFGISSFLPEIQPRSQGLSSLPPLVVGRGPGCGWSRDHPWGGKKICWKGGVTGFLIVIVTNLLSQGHSGMSLDSVLVVVLELLHLRDKKIQVPLTKQNLSTS